MHTIPQATAKMPYSSAARVVSATYETCQIQHCEKGKHPDVGIPLCERHLQKAWAAYQVVMADGIQSAAPRALKDRDVLTSDASGYVYFARVGNLIKIGWTHHVERRMTSLQADALLFSMPGTRDKESALHAMFKPYLDHGREWFEYHQDILDYIGSLRSAPRAKQIS